MPEEQEFVISLLQYKRLKRKEFLLQKGQICAFESFILKGCLRTYTVDEQGNEHSTMLAIEDWWTGDLYSFLTNKPSEYFIDALETTEIVQISRENLEKLYQEIPAFERFFRILFQNAFIAQHNRVTEKISFDASYRYTLFREKYPLLEQRIPQKYIASYLGITPVFLSMIRRKQIGR
jgi:CRP-like cAMP-binding protein